MLKHIRRTAKFIALTALVLLVAPKDLYATTGSVKVNAVVETPYVLGEAQARATSEIQIKRLKGLFSTNDVSSDSFLTRMQALIKDRKASN